MIVTPSAPVWVSRRWGTGWGGAIAPAVSRRLTPAPCADLAQAHPRDLRDRGRSEDVRDVVQADEPGLDRDSVAFAVDQIERQPVRTVLDRVHAEVQLAARILAARIVDAVAADSRSPTRAGQPPYARIVVVDNRYAVGGQGFEQLEFGLLDRQDAAEPLQVLRPDRGQHADARPGEAGHVADLAAPVRAHLYDQDFVLWTQLLVDRAADAQDRVEAGPRLEHAEARTHQRFGEVLGGGFAVAAV